jgi:SAM-dependent methyltransferase
MVKNEISNWFRQTGLLSAVDRLYFSLNKIRYSRKNKRFRKEHPFVKLPPDYMIYESFRMDYKNYYNDGRDTALWLIQELSRYFSIDSSKILDWGCGPARVVRHLPDLLPQAKVVASDYNEQTIEWCKTNVQGVEFVKNSVIPPLPFNGQSFDIIYALSVFTHLSLENHYRWTEEIYRLLKPGGIFLFSTQGNIFMTKLSEMEKKKFLRGELVARGKVKEGHRLFSAFHPQQFIYSILSDKWKVLKFTNGEMKDWGPEQDVWIVQKSP